MKVYLDPSTSSRGIHRVADALVRYAPPEIEIVHEPQDADLEIIHVNGRREGFKARIEALQEAGRAYAMIQYVLRSTLNPNTYDWMVMWQRAELVWSYYDLFALCDEDQTHGEFQFYYAPLGVDPDVFKQSRHVKSFIVGANAHDALVESAKECLVAAQSAGHPMFFLGPELNRPGVVCRTGITDTELADWYSQCKYVSGLRRIEGFEFPVIEGALCGARPIVFDRPHYRKWFGDFAVTIAEEPRPKVVDSLHLVFMQEWYPVSEEEKAMIRERFNWQTIIAGFWKRLCES